MKITLGYIADKRPYLIEEWHPTLNSVNTPYNVSLGSDKEIFWCCKECSHVWRTAAKHRALRNTGCPKCHERWNVGFPELAIFFYLKRIFKDAQFNTSIDIDRNGKYNSVDLLIPSINLIIEYDGGHTHRNRLEIDKDKSQILINKGYSVIRVRDNNLPRLDINGVQEYHYNRNSNKSIGRMIKDLIMILEEQYDGLPDTVNQLKKKINVDRDNISILAQVPPIIVKDNLLEAYPWIEEIWDYQKNHPLRPEHFKPSSNHKAWFTCKEHHSTLVQIGSKAKGHGCKICDGQEATEENNLELLFPDLAKEWNYELNKKTPDSYLPFSNEIVFWNCPKCHSTYDNAINDRTGGGENCPYCAGKRVNDTNCLSTTHPDLAKEWDYTKNEGLTPSDVTKGIHKKVWWLCDRGHSYPAMIYSRANGNGCPTCYELYGRFLPKKVKPENSLAAKKPEIAKQWHPTKNGDIDPEQVGAYARQDYWWLCENGHEWTAQPNSRRSTRCKYCN